MRSYSIRVWLLSLLSVAVAHVSHGNTTEGEGENFPPGVGTAFALQTHKTSSPSGVQTLPNDYRELERLRLELISEMYSLMYGISALCMELERAVKLDKLRDDYLQAAESSVSPGISWAAVRCRTGMLNVN